MLRNGAIHRDAKVTICDLDEEEGKKNIFYESHDKGAKKEKD